MKTYDVKGIMLGVGIGLILSSIINININRSVLTDDFIKVEASKRGFIIVDPKTLIDKEKINEKSYNNTLEDSKDKIEEKQENEEIKIEFAKGYNSYEAAEVLLEKGLIVNKDEFIDRLKQRGKADKIQYGSFILKKNLSYDDIIDIITKPKS